MPDMDRKSLIKRMAHRLWLFGAPLPNPLQMPLVDSICSDILDAPFFAGEGIRVMAHCTVSADTRIGAYSYIGMNCTVTRAIIGRYASIANNVSIGPGEHDVRAISTNSVFYESAYERLTERDCIIGDDVWIGDGCIIRRGVTVGTGAVVGANSFVNKDVMPFSIVAGSPAREIGKRFDPETLALIEKNRWWELPVEEARKCITEIEKQLGAQLPRI